MQGCISVRTLHNEGRDAAEAGNFDEAIYYYSMALEKDPTRATIYNSRGWAYYRTDRSDLSLKDLTRAITRDSTLDYM